MQSRFDRPVVRKLRELCLSLPETSESSSWGHPNFRAGKRTFAAFEIIEGKPSIALRLEPADADLLLRRPQFFVTPYGRGRWVSLWLGGKVNWKLLTKLIHRSYRTVANKRMLKLLDEATGGKPLDL